MQQENILKTGKKYVKELFSPEYFYNIPDYQRPYVWTSDQIGTLFDDIYHAYSNGAQQEYFLGCMVWNTKTKQLGEIHYESQDILDGQQRFITLYLFMAVLRDACSNSKMKTNITSRLVQEANEFDGIPQRNRIEFDIRNDQNFLNNFVLKSKGTQKEEDLKKISKDKRKDISTRNMASAILFIREWIHELTTSLEDKPKILDEYYTYLSTKVMIIFLSTPNNLDDAYNLFTVLNSRGMKLQASDILKAQTLRSLDETSRKDCAKKWEDFESALGEPYESFDEFLWSIVFCKMKQKSDVNTSLNRAFTYMHDQKLLQRGLEVFNTVEHYYGHLIEIQNEEICKDSCGNFFANLNKILSATYGSTYLTPLMYYRNCFGDRSIDEFLVRLDNLLSVYWLSGKTSQQFQPRMFAIMREMDRSIEKYRQDISYACKEFLSSPVLDYSYSHKLSEVVELPHFLEILDSENWGDFSGSKINKARYLLLKLDLLTCSLQSSLSFDTKRISVEHLLPRNPQSTQGISEEFHKRWLHRLGNIVLVDRRKNSSFANKSFEEKKAKYKGSIENRPNTNHVFMTYSTWNAETIQENHDRVLKLLRDYYTGNSLKTVRQVVRS